MELNCDGFGVYPVVAQVLHCAQDCRLPYALSSFIMKAYHFNMDRKRGLSSRICHINALSIKQLTLNSVVVAVFLPNPNLKSMFRG